jgi:PAS domain S-box-containing protein
MFQLNAVSLGILFIALGLVIWVVIRLLMRGVPGRRSTNPAPEKVEISDKLNANQNAVLEVQTGGWVVSINERGRQLFELQKGEEPNLERLARRVRPAETFLSLCVSEGEARFVLNGRLVEGTSYFLEDKPTPLMMVTIRQPELVESLGEGEAGLSSHTLQTITALTQSMAANLDLETTLSAIFDNVDKLIPADFMEITIWEVENEWLVPYRVLSLPGVERKLEYPSIRYHVGEGYSGYLARERQPLLISDVEARSDLRLVADSLPIPIHSYLGVPLIMGGEFIGTLELGSLNTGMFSPKDLGLINLLSGQAAIAIHNALLFRQEKRRAAELAGLAQLAQAFSSARDPKGLYTLLVQSIVPLIQVEIIGFLIYNENQHVLEGQVPFYGLPQQFMEMYHLPIPPGSMVEKTLLTQDVIISDNAMEDAHWKELGLDPMAITASLRDTVLIPLISARHMLGYLQASNHIKGVIGFSQDEIRLLTIIANQAAPIIENSNLVLQTRQRAQRAEGLRRIASLAGSAATLDEILKYALQELAELVHADVAAVFLLDQMEGSLRFHNSSLYGDFPNLPDRNTSLLVDDPQFPFSATGGQHHFSSGHLSEATAIIPFYQQIREFWKCESLIIVPMMVRDRGIGELWLGSQNPDYFERGDLQMAMTAAGQIAGVVEQSYLAQQTDESLRQRVDQLTALTRISRELSTSLDLKYLLELVHAEALRTTRAECGTILLFNTPQDQVGKDSQIRFFIGDPPVGDLSEAELDALNIGEPVSLSDAALQVFSTSHLGIQSAMLAPILYQDKRIGLISLHSAIAQRFDKSALEIAQSLAAHASVALGNAFQYEDQLKSAERLKRQLETQNKLSQVSHTLLTASTRQEALAAIADAIQQTTVFQVVVISLCDSQTGILHRVHGAGLTQSVWEDLVSHTQPWASIARILEPDYRFGNVYFIPADKLPVVPEDLHMVTVLSSVDNKEVDAWNPDDMLLVPLYDSHNMPLGLISLDAPLDGRRPDRPTLEALELFALQVCMFLENNALTDSLKEQLGALQADQQRLTGAADHARQHLPMLLQQGLEKSLTIQQLSHQIERVQSGLEMAEIVSRQPDIPSVLRTLGRELLTRFNLQTVLMAEKTPNGPRFIEPIGSVPENVNPESYYGQRNPLRQLLEDSQVLIVPDLGGDAEWRSNPLLTALHGRSFIGLPLMIGDGRTAAVLAIGQKQLDPMDEEDRQLFIRVSGQVSVSVQNLHLLVETRRRLQEVNLLLSFSRKLGSLNPTNILQSLVESVLQVISSAHAGWVALWDEKEEALIPQAAAGYSENTSLRGIRFVEQDLPGGSVSLPLRAYKKAQPMRVAEVAFAQEYVLSPDDLLRYRKATGGRLPVSSMLVPLVAGENVLGVLVLDNFNIPAAFTEEDENLTQSLAQQAALGLENARLFTSAEQRAAQLQALTQVAGTITSSLQSEDLIASLLDQLKLILPYETATLWLRRGNQVSVAAASGFSDAESRTGISVDVGDSVLFQEMAKTGQAISVEDIRLDSRFPSIMEPDKFSWLGIPLMAKSQLVGVIALEKTEPGFYNPEHIQAATTFASQAAVGLENARLFEESVRRAAELDQRSQRLALLNAFSSDLTVSLDVDYILKLTAQQLLNALSASRVAAVLLDESGQSVLRAEAPAWASTLPLVLPKIPLLERLRESLGIFNASNVSAEPELAPLMESYFAPFNIHSILIVPLVIGNNLHGWYLVQTTNVYRFSPSEIELARTISNQCAIAVQNARLFLETRQLKDELELRVEERTIELRREHQNTQTLLKIITELSASLDMGQVLNRTLGVLNDSAGAEQSMIILAQGNDRSYQAGTPLVEGNFERNSADNRPEKTISQWVIKKRVSALVSDILSDERWSIPADSGVKYHSVIAVPLMLGEEALGALMLFHHLPSFFILEQVSLVEATARQIAISLNNAELFNLIRDQSERMGSMLREQQIEASRSRAILESVADGIVVTDGTNHITLFNRSAETILGLKSSAVIGELLDKYAGLFGRRARTWIQTVRKWSDRPQAYQPGETYSEELDLEGGKVVSVHLAPVIWRLELLGTVSIFRDITHEVQVDRLKSEFLANVSHELRTPMTSIKGYAEIMLMGASGALTAQQTHFLQIIKSNAERLGVLVNDLLDISRIESGRITLTFDPLNLGEIAQEVIEYYRQRSQEENKAMNFALQIQDELPQIAGDAERIRQVISNLVSNSYNYTPANGNIHVSLQRIDGEVQVDIEDNGIGIPIKDQQRVFERFFRGDDPLVLATAGTGLGLALARTLVEMHHGRIWFKSNGISGEGSTFSFSLPTEQTEE